MSLLTKDECKKIISRLGFELGVSPKLVALRLLNDLDKTDMLNGDLPIASLRAHMEVWRDNGMPDYVSEKKEPLQTPDD
jgi:hypothetical protein